MVFKRYINKHGKKLGPYYYENVRSQDGKVKSVYVGTNPQHHPKHRIRKPLVFLIIFLVLLLILGSSLFFLQNRAYIITKVTKQEPDFDVDQILLKVLIRSGESIEKEIRVMNTGNGPTTINIEAIGLNDIVKINSPSFTLKAGQTKIGMLDFMSVLEDQRIEQQPGIYIGKLALNSEKGSREIPVVAEIETKNVLFDMNLVPVAFERKVRQGSETTIEVRLFNLDSIESTNVGVEYFVKDMNGNTILTESETVVVKTQASFFKTISIPKSLAPGQYVFAAQAKFGNSVGTASYLFEVINPEAEATFVQFCKNSVLCMGLSLTTILLLFAATAYFYFFVGAFLYGKITGIITLPKKRKEEIDEVEEEPIKEPSESILNKISNKVQNWKKEREKIKAQSENLKKEKEEQNLLEEKLQLGRINRQREEERKEQEESEKQEELKKQFDAKRIQEEQEKKRLEKVRLSKERKYKIKEFFHGIGLFKTPEEKLQKAKLERLKKEEFLRKERELEKQKEHEKAVSERQKILKEKDIRKQEEINLRILEEEKRKKEIQARRKQQEETKALEEKSRLEDERRKLEEQEKFQKDLERQKQQKFRRQKLDMIKQIESRLIRNKEVAEKLDSELRNLDAEKRNLLGRLRSPKKKV